MQQTLSTRRGSLPLLKVRQMRRELVRLDDMIDAACERDRLQATRPATCWCFGVGGSGQRAFVLPESVGLEVEGRHAYGLEDTVSFLAAYCDCADGLARRAADDALRLTITGAHPGLLMPRDVAAVWHGMGIPEHFSGCTLASYPAHNDGQQAALALVKKWLSGPAWALVLLGAFGLGKTGLAIGCLRWAAERGTAGLFVKTPDMLVRWRGTFGKSATTSEGDVLASLRAVPYLVLDDMGVDTESDFATLALYQVLDDRHDHERRTILTTNLSVGELRLHLGARTMERFEEGAVFVPMTGDNLRRAAR